MTFKDLLSQFSYGVNWNALFYGIYKASSLIITLLLFKYLTSHDFSVWALVNSTIFLVLLWLDFGFRKSIPRYCPEFAKDKSAQKRFIKTLLIFQTSILLLAAPFFLYILSKTTQILSFSTVIIILASIIFVLESIVSLLRLIYHAHFWIKQFNTLTTIALMIEVTANIIVIMIATQSSEILHDIFVTKIISGIIITTIGIFMLPRLYHDRNYPGNQIIDFRKTFHQFIKHSLIMWVNNNLKSLSERNFLVPFFTFTLGPSIANIFKVANDGALFFYRIALKSIGTTDTALLSHVEEMSDEQKAMPIAFQKLLSKITAVCFPLLGLLFILLVKSDVFFSSPFVFQIFFIMSIGYLIELIVSPYERVLEVKRRYGLLFIAYVPYIIMIACLFLNNSISFIGLLYSLLIIHGVRLVSSFIMVYLARKRYVLLFPSSYILSLIYIYLPLTLLLYILISLIPSISKYISYLVHI